MFSVNATCSFDIEQAHEQAVLHQCLEATRVGDEPQQVVVDRAVIGLHGGDEIDGPEGTSRRVDHGEIPHLPHKEHGA